jgi:hypothetical protein
MTVALITGRIARVAPELRASEVGSAPPSGREGSTRRLGVERPHVEVLHAVRLINIVQCGALTEDAA